MDFCYVWLRRIINNHGFFGEASTRNTGELTGNINMSRGLEHFAAGLSAVFQKMAIALKPGAPLAFTYHHNKIGCLLSDCRRHTGQRTHLLRIAALPG